MALILGRSSESTEIILEEVDLSDPKSPAIIETYYLGYKNAYPRILAVSPSKTKVYIFLDEESSEPNLLIFDKIKKTAIKNQKRLIKKVQTMTFSSDGKTLLTGSNDQFMIIELFLDYPNKQIFSGTGLDVISNFSPSGVVQMNLSPDGNTLCLLRYVPKEGGYFKASIFEIVDVSNINEPKILSSFENSTIFQRMDFSCNFNTAFLIQSEYTVVLEISNKSSPRIKTAYSGENSFSGIVMSSDEKTGFVQRHLYYSDYLAPFHLDDTSGSKSSSTFNNILVGRNARFMLINDKTLLTLDNEILIYNVSDPKAPKVISSLPLVVNGLASDIRSHLLSPDGKT